MTTGPQKLRSCDDPDSKSLNVDQAKERILESVTTIRETEELPILEALSRITAQTIKSPINVPSHTNSAMDGYALAGETYSFGMLSVAVFQDLFVWDYFFPRIAIH